MPPTRRQPFPGRYVIFALGIFLIVMAVLHADGFLYVFADEPAPPWITACLGMSLVFFMASDLLAQHENDLFADTLVLAVVKLTIFFSWLLIS